MSSRQEGRASRPQRRGETRGAEARLGGHGQVRETTWLTGGVGRLGCVGGWGATSFTHTSAPEHARASGGPTPSALRWRSIDHCSPASARERYGTASDRLVDKAFDRRMRECGCALRVNPACLATGTLQQLLRIRQPLASIEVEPNAVRAPADRKNALVPSLAGRIADDEAVAIFIHHFMGGGQTLSQRPTHGANEPSMRGRELGDTRTHLGFRRSSLNRRLGAAGNLGFDLGRRGFCGGLLRSHHGSLVLAFRCSCSGTP